MVDWLELSDAWNENGLANERVKLVGPPRPVKPRVYRWMGEVTPLPKESVSRPITPSTLFLLTDEWKAIRKSALALYGAVCMKCEATERIQVDHILPRYRFPELALDIDNLQILCWGCNRAKGYHKYDDYRATSGKKSPSLAV